MKNELKMKKTKIRLIFNENILGPKHECAKLTFVVKLLYCT